MALSIVTEGKLMDWIALGGLAILTAIALMGWILALDKSRDSR